MSMVIVVAIALVVSIVTPASAANDWYLQNQSAAYQQVGSIYWGPNGINPPPFYSGGAEAGAFNMLIKEYNSAHNSVIQTYSSYLYCIDGYFFNNADWFSRLTGGPPGPPQNQNPPIGVPAWKTIVWMNNNDYYDSLTSQAKSVGYQLALWEVVNDFGGTLDLSAGNFRASGFSTAAMQAANDYLFPTGGLGMVSDYSGQIYYADGQNMLDHPTVPEPMSLMLGAMGLGSVVGLRRLRRR